RRGPRHQLRPDVRQQHRARHHSQNEVGVVAPLRVIRRNAGQHRFWSTSHVSSLPKPRPCWTVANTHYVMADAALQAAALNVTALTAWNRSTRAGWAQNANRRPRGRRFRIDRSAGLAPRLRPQRLLLLRRLGLLLRRLSLLLQLGLRLQ